MENRNRQINKNNDVFISYSSKDEEVALKVKEALEDRKVVCWMANEYTIGSGEDFREKIVEALSNSKIILIVLSKNSINSIWVALELAQALNNNLKIYTLRIDDEPLDELLDFKLGCSQIADGRFNMDSVVEHLALNIKKEKDLIIEKEKNYSIAYGLKIKYIDNILFYINIFFFALVFVIFKYVMNNFDDINRDFAVDIVSLNVLIVLIVFLVRIIIYLYTKNTALLGAKEYQYYLYLYYKKRYLFIFRRKKKALRTLELSVNQNYLPAIEEMAYLYENGVIVRKDLELSKLYKEIAFKIKNKE